MVKEIDNIRHPGFDQTNKYDFAGRLKYNQAGPSSQELQYDAFGNLTERANNFYGYEDRFVAGYTNNRKTSSGSAPVYDTYDNAGNIVHTVFNPYTPHGDRPYNDSKWWHFDAAGRVTYFSQYTTASGYEADAREAKHDTAFDGDGRAVMENKRERMCDLAESPEECEGTWVGYPVHYLISSVTGQKINTMYDGENSEKHVYMGGTNIAREVPEGETVHRSFTTTDPVTGSTAEMGSDGTVSQSGRTELAALGTAIPLTEPPRSLPPPSNYENGHVGDSEYGCVDPDTNDPMPCSLLAFMVNSGYGFQNGPAPSVIRDRFGHHVTNTQIQLPNYFIGADNRPMGYGNVNDASGYGYAGLYQVDSTEEGGGSKWIVDPSAVTKFDKKKVKSVVKKAIKLTEKKECDEALNTLSDGEIPSLNALVSQYLDNNGELANISDGSNIDVPGYGVDSAQLPAFVLGSGTSNAKTYLNSAFFSLGGNKLGSLEAQAIVLIHEAVHQFYRGGEYMLMNRDEYYNSDYDWGKESNPNKATQEEREKGSKALTDLIIDKCYRNVRVLVKDLGGI